MSTVSAMLDLVTDRSLFAVTKGPNMKELCMVAISVTTKLIHRET